GRRAAAADGPGGAPFWRWPANRGRAGRRRRLERAGRGLLSRGRGPEGALPPAGRAAPSEGGEGGGPALGGGGPGERAAHRPRPLPGGAGAGRPGELPRGGGAAGAGRGAAAPRLLVLVPARLVPRG